MIKSAQQSNCRLGFLTVVEIPDFGFSGGLLIVSALGKPIEFHCTAPATINRAQKILYGRTWQSFLCCDQIGISLVDKARTQPDVYLTDKADILPLAEVVDPPLIFLDTNVETPSNAGAPLRRASLSHFEINERKLWFESAALNRDREFQSVCESFAQHLPLDEPFERIRQAIDEAQSVGK